MYFLHIFPQVSYISLMEIGLKGHWYEAHPFLLHVYSLITLPST